MWGKIMSVSFSEEVVTNILNYKPEGEGDLEQVKFLGGNNYELIIYYNEGRYYCKTNFRIINGKFVFEYGIYGLIPFTQVKKLKKVIEYYEQ
jgi:hypothetical protein